LITLIGQKKKVIYYLFNGIKKGVDMRCQQLKIPHLLAQKSKTLLEKSIIEDGKQQHLFDR
ncbi:MAG: hypothetical protein Q8844_03065, partial [Pigeon pea little leaf phytoplasma]|nr:hypothetical protein [Pigeon pea little leaf phytoplasma]